MKILDTNGTIVVCLPDDKCGGKHILDHEMPITDVVYKNKIISHFLTYIQRFSLQNYGVLADLSKEKVSIILEDIAFLRFTLRPMKEHKWQKDILQSNFVDDESCIEMCLKVNVINE